jgi:hypothetical protein
MPHDQEDQLQAHKPKIIPPPVGLAGTRRPTEPPAYCRTSAQVAQVFGTHSIWSLLKRSIVNFAAADMDGLVRIIKRKLKKIQYRPHLIDGCLAATGLIIEPWSPLGHYEFKLCKAVRTVTRGDAPCQGAGYGAATKIERNPTKS